MQLLPTEVQVAPSTYLQQQPHIALTMNALVSNITNASRFHYVVCKTNVIAVMQAQRAFSSRSSAFVSSPVAPVRRVVFAAVSSGEGTQLGYTLL